MLGHIIGWSHSRFGKLEGETLESLIAGVVDRALEHAGVDATEVDEIVIGHFNQGLDPQGFPSSLVLQANPRLRMKPAVRVENACATGSAAVRNASALIGSGQAGIVLVIGVEKMTACDAETVRRALVSASYVPEEAGEGESFAGHFGRIAQHYYQRYGDQSDVLARIAAKNHRNGVQNPYAHMQRDLGYEFCATVSDKNPLVAGPLRRTDCSMVSDGAAALVLADSDVASVASHNIRLRAMTHVNDFLPISRRDPIVFEGAEQAWARAMASAEIALDDLDFVETHDCFTIAELIEYEAMGLAPRGQGARAIAEGWVEPEGRLPVNVSGGLKAKGHPIGATGVSMHVIAAMQLDGSAAGIQLPGPRLGGIFNMGGTAVTNYVSILERLD